MHKISFVRHNTLGFTKTHRFGDKLLSGRPSIKVVCTKSPNIYRTASTPHPFPFV